MRHKHLIIIICCMCLPCITYSQDNMPIRDVELVDDGVIVTYHFNGALYQQDPLYPDTKLLKIPGFGLNSIAGEPAFPFRWDTFAIPDGVNVEIELLNCHFIDSLFSLAPARPALLLKDTIGYNQSNVSRIKPYSGFFPDTIIKRGGIQYYRGQGLVRVCILPIQYNYISKVIRIYKEIKYKIHFNSPKSLAQSKEKSTIHPFYSISDHFLENISLNYVTKSRKRKSGYLGNEKDNRHYLIVTTTEMENALSDFVEWKRLKGFNTHVLSRASWVNSDSVKSAIVEAYHNYSDSIYYLLILGGTSKVPSIRINNNITPEHLTDTYYGYMDGINDEIAEFPVGRIVVSTTQQALNVLNKIINYEKTPVLDSAFYSNGVHCAFFEDKSKRKRINNVWVTIPPDSCEDKRCVLTSEEIRVSLMDSLSSPYNITKIYNTSFNNTWPLRWNNDLLAFGDTIPLYLQKPYYSWTGNADSISQAVNNGVFYMLYNGHGTFNGWDNPYFKNTNIDNLTNFNKTPVVFSIACKTGYFDSYDIGFASKFLQKENGGCVSIIAASEDSYAGYNDALIENMFNFIWPESNLKIRFPQQNYTPESPPRPVYEIGNVLELGKIGMSETDYGSFYDDLISSPCIQHTKEIFHCFGDPSMMIYTQIPQKFQQPIITCRDGKIIVQTIEDDVRISLYTPSSNNVDSYIGNYVEYSTTADSVIICLDKHNYIPDICTYYKNLYIQNETISEQRSYYGKSVYVGNNVTSEKPAGDVIIQNADATIEGENIYLMPGTTILNSDFKINCK